MERKLGRILLVDLARECLAFVYVFLAETLCAVPEHFVEENCCRASSEKRWTRVGLNQRRGYQSFEFLAQNQPLREHAVLSSGASAGLIQS